MEKDLTKESREALKKIWETYSQRREERGAKPNSPQSSAKS